MRKIQDIPINERPREKLLLKGAKHLTDRELLAIILGKGTAKNDVLPLIQHFSDRKQEHFTAISLNGANEVLNVRIVTIGLVNQSQVHPREVFADALTDRASAIIVAHNHPSGNLTPSMEDIEVTKRIKEAGKILGLKLLDHIIFSTKGSYSFKENEKL